MDNPEVVTVEAVRNFILHKGGKVTNHELVRHFKGYLTNPDNRVEARNHFKEIVNFVATIIRNDDGEKYLVLKKRFRNQGMVGCNSMDGLMSSPPMSPEPLNSVDSANSLGYLYPNQLPGGYHYSNSQDSIGRYSGSQDGVNRYQSQDSVNSYHSQDGANRYPSPDGVGRYFSQDNMNRYASQEGVNRYLNNQDLNRFSQQDSINHFMSPPRHVEPPPYRPPPPPVRPHLPSQSSFDDNMSLSSSVSSGSINRQSSLDDPFLSSGDGPPPVPPRRRSSCDKIQPMKADNKENANSNKEFSKRPKTIGAESDLYSAGAIDVENRKISVKECTQKFNRLASESSPKHFNLPTASTISSALKKRHEKAADHEDDTASVTSVGSDAKSREWMIQSARSEYQTLAKLAAENPRLVRFKDPCNYTALHWAAKHGSEDVVKLIAGTYNADVNARTNGGYTPLHIAMQFGNEDIFNLLVQVYGADPNIRDYSGRKPRQYQTNQDTAVSADTFRKIKARKKQSEKDLGFLRIGSLNVRVKKTTEAFSNFLGKSQSSVEKIHKSWGSADNIQQNDNKTMPPPKFAPIKKRKSKKAQDFMSHSTPSTPDLRDVSSAESKFSDLKDTANAQDSDSDTACGFGSNWQP